MTFAKYVYKIYWWHNKLGEACVLAKWFIRPMLIYTSPPFLDEMLVYLTVTCHHYNRRYPCREALWEKSILPINTAHGPRPGINPYSSAITIRLPYQDMPHHNFSKYCTKIIALLSDLHQIVIFVVDWFLLMNAITAVKITIFFSLPVFWFTASPYNYNGNDNEQQPAGNGTRDDVRRLVRVLLSGLWWSYCWCWRCWRFSEESLHARDVTINGVRNVCNRLFNNGNECVFRYGVIIGSSGWKLQIEC